MSTIVALSTPRGSGALSVVRLSGPHALSVLQTFAASLPELTPRLATLARLQYPETNETLDEVLITFFRAPHSVTGEDVVEISCHGSQTVVRKVIELSLKAGARLADPGEFSLRALLNGKMNLSEAEAIRDLISAQTESAARQAARQLSGELALTLEPLKRSLIEVIVVLESALEFVEDDLPATQRSALLEKLSYIASGIDDLATTYNAGHLLKDGIRVAITGRPNVGKSSLFNRLVSRDRAIVTATPGTTRDTLTEVVDMEGVPVVLTDTAGLRETTDLIETMGIERAHRAIIESDVVVNILEVGELDTDVITPTALVNTAKTIRVFNKVDLLDGRDIKRIPGELYVSAKTGAGIEDLQKAILRDAGAAVSDTEGLLITNVRHYDLLVRAHTELEESLVSVNESRSEELTLVSLHNALRFLGEITGETTTEDILSQIFSTFCIGK